MITLNAMGWASFSVHFAGEFIGSAAESQAQNAAGFCLPIRAKSISFGLALDQEYLHQL
jgi:hypothetical protein